LAFSVPLYSVSNGLLGSAGLPDAVEQCFGLPEAGMKKPSVNRA
jgi:hypothetical protein